MAKKSQNQGTITQARLLWKGSIVSIQGSPREEVVRGVDVVVHLANGQDVVLSPSQEVEVHEPEKVPDEVVEQALAQEVE